MGVFCNSRLNCTSTTRRSSCQHLQFVFSAVLELNLHWKMRASWGACCRSWVIKFFMSSCNRTVHFTNRLIFIRRGAWCPRAAMPFEEILIRGSCEVLRKKCVRYNQDTEALNASWMQGKIRYTDCVRGRYLTWCIQFSQEHIAVQYVIFTSPGDSNSDRYWPL